MRTSWKVGILVTCLAVISGAAMAVRVLEKHNENERKLADAAQACRVRAEQGDAEAEASLAYIYSHGQGVKRDYDEAARWYRKSADKGNARGETGTGYMYYTGEGVLQDYTEAARWYRKAADQGYPKGQRDFGDMYYNGIGQPQDYAEAARWYRRAADQGDARAQSYLGGMYSSGKGLPRDPAEGDRWYHKAAANGDEYAQRLLGLRGAGLSTAGRIYLAINAVACFFLLRAYLKPISSRIGNRDWRALACGILFLSSIGMMLFESYHGVPQDPVYIAALFRWVRGFALGMATAMLVSVVWRHSAKRILIASCVWFGALNLILLGFFVYGLAHHVNLHALRSVILRPVCLAVEAFPIGSAIAAVVLLFHPDRTDADGDILDGGVTASEPLAEDGAVT